MKCFPAAEIDACPAESITLNNKTQELYCELFALQSVVPGGNKCRQGEVFVADHPAGPRCVQGFG